MMMALTPEQRIRISQAILDWAQHHPNPEHTIMFIGKSKYSAKDIADRFPLGTDPDLDALIESGIQSTSVEDIVESFRW